MATPNLLQQGVEAAKAGRKEEARRLLLQVVEWDERNEQAWLWLSGVVDSPQEKLTCLQNVLDINPDNSVARAGVEWLEEQAAAAEPTERCPRCEAPTTQAETQCAQCGLPLIVACPTCGDYVDVTHASCPACGNTLGDFRQGAAYHLGLARAYLGRHKPERAREAMARAQAEAPRDPRVLESLAELYEQTGDLDAAADAYERAIKLAPENAALRARLGAIYHQRADSERARAAYEQAAQIDDQDPVVLMELARLRLAEGQVGEAVDLLQRVVKQKPLDAEAHLLLGHAYLRLEQPKRARHHYEYAQDYAPPGSQMLHEAEEGIIQLRYPALQAEVDAPVRAGPRKRPGCVTLYAALLGLSAACGLLGLIPVVLGATGGSSILSDPALTGELPIPAAEFQTLFSTYLAIAVAISVGSIALNLVQALGLWLMKNWARILVLILNGLGLVGLVIYLVGTLAGASLLSGTEGLDSSLAFFACGPLLAIGLQGYILFWFWANGDLFN
ncbi:MAG: tetratricopeptide repeat protein [Anaerolineae bacterium]|jgi:tetratricopeptide (TPR) repeat protein